MLSLIWLKKKKCCCIHVEYSSINLESKSFLSLLCHMSMRKIESVNQILTELKQHFFFFVMYWNKIKSHGYGITVETQVSVCDINWSLTFLTCCLEKNYTEGNSNLKGTFGYPFTLGLCKQQALAAYEHWWILLKKCSGYCVLGKVLKLGRNPSPI